MASPLRFTATVTLILTALLPHVLSHTIITYPGIRGDNLKTNGSIADEDGLGVGKDNTYPYGMQWAYPCMNCSV